MDPAVKGSTVSGYELYLPRCSMKLSWGGCGEQREEGAGLEKQETLDEHPRFYFYLCPSPLTSWTQHLHVSWKKKKKWKNELIIQTFGLHATEHLDTGKYLVWELWLSVSFKFLETCSHIGLLEELKHIFNSCTSLEDHYLANSYFSRLHSR